MPRSEATCSLLVPVRPKRSSASCLLQTFPKSEGFGCRLSLSTKHQATLDLSLAEAPAIGDAVVEEEGAKVFLEQSAALFLDDKILDASVEGERVSFSIVEQRQDWSQDGQPKSFDPRSIG
jgi:iron-sulfur cluster assembly protein